jgi:L-amino acid N-acyltransferase YncA
MPTYPVNGLELLRRLSDAGHRLPAIMITGNSDVPMAVQAMKAGASDFIEKPIGRGELLASGPLARGPPNSRQAGQAMSQAPRDGGTMNLVSRLARLDDAPTIAAICNEGIADRIATFETELRSAEQIERWFDGRHPKVVVQGPHGAVLAFASTSTYHDRDCYAGIAEFSVYVARRHRGKGAGRVAMAALIDAATKAGLWKLVSRIFPENRVQRASSHQRLWLFSHECRLCRIFRRLARFLPPWGNAMDLWRSLGW